MDGGSEKALPLFHPFVLKALARCRLVTCLRCRFGRLCSLGTELFLGHFLIRVKCTELTFSQNPGLFGNVYTGVTLKCYLIRRPRKKFAFLKYCSGLGGGVEGSMILT